MNKIITSLLILLLSLSVNGQSRLYFEEDSMPNALLFLPEPPAYGSEAFRYDSCQYEWGKSIRISERGITAALDANTDIDYIAGIFGPIMGITINKRETPEIWELLKVATKTGGKADNRAKAHYMRTRPFVYFNEPSLTPADEPSLRTNGSYPSGHTLLGWLSALILAEIDPADQNAIFARGYEYGQSRVIVGVHWQSDVNAGRVVAAAAFARLHTSEQYLRQLQKAQAEFKIIKTK